MRKGKAKTEGPGVAGFEGRRREHLGFIEIGVNRYDVVPKLVACRHPWVEGLEGRVPCIWETAYAGHFGWRGSWGFATPGWWGRDSGEGLLRVLTGKKTHNLKVYVLSGGLSQVALRDCSEELRRSQDYRGFVRKPR